VPEIAVVIPFYQRSPGILARALESVRRQEISDFDVRIVIVDDASPMSLADELKSIRTMPGGRLEVITQSNGGPGAARNAALHRLTNDPPDFVAFLDSDDQWEPHHLRRALGVMGNSVDFYGADHRRLGEAGTFFDLRREARETLKRFGVSRIVDQAPVFDLNGSQAVQAFVDNYLVQTYTVVLRWSRLMDIRFDSSLRAAGEDHLFWLDSSSVARVCAIDLKMGSSCLDGVNIYENAVSWDDGATLKRAYYLMQLWYKAKVRFSGDAEVVDAINVRLKNHRRFFAYLWIRGLSRRRDMNLPLLRDIAASDRRAIPRLIGALVGLSFDRWRKGSFAFVEH